MTLQYRLCTVWYSKNINNSQAKNFCTAVLALKSCLNVPISSNNFNCGVKVKTGALFKRLQQHSADNILLRYKYTRHSNIRVVLPCKAAGPVRYNRGLQAMEWDICWPCAGSVCGVLPSPNRFPCHSKQQIGFYWGDAVRKWARRQILLISTFRSLLDQSESFLSFFLFLSSWLWSSSQFPTAAGEALGVRGRQLVLHFPLSKGNRSVSINKKAAWAVFLLHPELLPQLLYWRPARMIRRRLVGRRSL